MSSEKKLRINKFIAASGLCSRRKADDLIKQGHITINNQTVTSLGIMVSPEDDVKYKGKTLKLETSTYILLNKPKDCITTAKDQRNRSTVYDLIKNVPERVFPVGRLDRNTTGILLLTNDGELSTKLAHPSGQIPKLYEATLNKSFTKEDFNSLKQGITLDDGPVKIDDLAYPESNNAFKVGLKIHSGRNHVVRRIFAQLGYKVENLDRVLFANLTKKELPRGKWRYLQENEVRLLKQLTNDSEKHKKTL